MNTPAHIVFSLAALGAGRAATWPLAIVAGALIPDVAMMVFYAWHKILGTGESLIWSYHYYLPEWQAVFDIANSIPLILVAFTISYRLKRSALMWLFASMLVHCVLDLLAHHDDGHRHFYPFLQWRFVSPISYWDPAHYGNIVGLAEVLLVLVLSVWLWWSASRQAQVSSGMQSRLATLKWVLVLTNLAYISFFYYVIRTWA